MRWLTADSALRSDRNWFAQRFADLFSKKYLSAPFQSVYPPILPLGCRKWVPRRAPRNMSKTLASHPTGNRKCLSHMPEGGWHILSVLHFILIQIPGYELEGSQLLNSSGDKIAERFVYMWMCVCVISASLRNVLSGSYQLLEETCSHMNLWSESLQLGICDVNTDMHRSQTLFMDVFGHVWVFDLSWTSVSSLPLKIWHNSGREDACFTVICSTVAVVCWTDCCYSHCEPYASVHLSSETNTESRLMSKSVYFSQLEFIWKSREEVILLQLKVVVSHDVICDLVAFKKGSNGSMI